jgi:hypothetical protein
MIATVQMKLSEQPDGLESQWLVPVMLNERGPFQFAIDIGQTRTLVSANTIENLGISLGFTEDEVPKTLSVSPNILFPAVTLRSIGVGGAVVRDTEVIVWGRPVIPRELWDRIKGEEGLHHLGSSPLSKSAIEKILECQGVLGADFLARFRVTLDLAEETMVLEPR